MFVVFEGIDNSGKSTLAKNVNKYFLDNYVSSWFTSEPTDSEIGKFTRRILSGEIKLKDTEKTLSLLFSADRAEHNIDIKEHLNNGEIVLCDRYYSSSIAYNCLNDKSFSLNLEYLNFKSFLKPDIIFYLNIDIDKSIKRLYNRGREIEIFENKDYLTKVKKKYEEVLLNNANYNVIILDALKNEQELTDECVKTIIKSLPKH